MTAVTTNTRPQRVFSSVETCVLVDVNQPLPWFFTRWAREDSFSVSWAPGRTCRRFSRFCNILLQDLAPLHVKITRRKNLLRVSRRKLKLSTLIILHWLLCILSVQSAIFYNLLAKILTALQCSLSLLLALFQHAFFLAYFLRCLSWRPETNISNHIMG